VLSVLVLLWVAAPLAAQTVAPPYFGPPGMHPNTLPALVDTDGTPGPSAGDSPAYFQWLATGELIRAANPWEECAQTTGAFVIEPSMSGQQGVYDSFFNRSFGRQFTFDTFDVNGDPLGGAYAAQVGDTGTAMLEKSWPSQAHYDQIHLAGSGPGSALDVVLPLVVHAGEGASYVGVGNIANLGVIGTCGNADANTAIMIPLGRHNGRPAIVLDLEGNGAPSSGFLPGPPLGMQQPPPAQQAIPTLTSWGLALLLMAVLVAGLLVLRGARGTLSV
jgi:hypothetical protein